MEEEFFSTDRLKSPKDKTALTDLSKKESPPRLERGEAQEEIITGFRAARIPAPPLADTVTGTSRQRGL